MGESNETLDAQLAHGICMVIAFGAILPLHAIGAGIARLQRDGDADKPPLQARTLTGIALIVRNTLAFILIVIGISLIKTKGHAETAHGHDVLTDTHKILGWVLFSGAMLQFVIGLCFLKHTPQLHKFHRGVGVVILVIAVGFEVRFYCFTSLH